MRSVHFTDHGPVVDGYDVVEIDGGEIAGHDELLEALDNALGLPDYFGHNWDALDEVLRDTEVAIEANVVVISDATAFWREHPQLAGTLVEVWLDSAPEGLHLVFSW